MFRRRPRKTKDPVSPTLRLVVFARDNWTCVAPSLDTSSGPCRNRWGQPLPTGPTSEIHLTLDHVRDQPMMGKRAPSDLQHLVTLCWWHHLGGWATANRPRLREHLRSLHPD